MCTKHSTISWTDTSARLEYCKQQLFSQVFGMLQSGAPHSSSWIHGLYLFRFVLVFLSSSCAWFVASLFFSPENGGFAPVLFWTGCIYLRKLLVWHCIKWSCSKVHVPGLKQISRKQHPFNSFKVVTLKNSSGADWDCSWA